ncbi:uncharacterized protein BDW43DRAFT_297914 [Aspergillus alliaceus]|uniref:uncharacterized protein n=1 Tax=Petromyces alliaceus TaxID=209559 RepID=UPI0012A69A1C|nr:uncharacterized protein BDW43DRAFT_297914 [Aspergillus alliaceus]KAB8236892.1 hypothetical protein BDW43DRAFT_297914 [Aspergillus alliaceus]
MTDAFAFEYPSPLAGYENLEPLPVEFNEDGKSIKNPQHGVRSKAYEEFPDPLAKDRQGGFDVHIYHFQNNPDQVAYARALYERVRREFPELRIYRFYEGPLGPHPIAMFEVNLFTPAQFGAFIPWLIINRGPLSALLHPNSTEEEEERNHTQRATWLGEKSPPAMFHVAPPDLSATAIPGYVLEYAPLVWLHSQDVYLPSDIGEQLLHTAPTVDWKPIEGASSPVTLNNLDQLNNHGNTSVYLTSKEGIDADPQPAWFGGVKPNAEGRTQNAVSSTIIVRDHGDGTLDAFYFYFYAEHNMIRFSEGVPQAIWYSQHASGQAFTYRATEKKDKRPIAYSGKGTHANYAISGNHDHTIPGFNLPGGLIVDQTDQGTLWDPILSAYAYKYDASEEIFQPYDSGYPVEWLNFNGQWGDDALPGGPELFGQKKYAAGPNGPKFKKLVREKVCPSSPCVVLPFRIWENQTLAEYGQ